mmetsp:Transcript_19213/g.41635  ORF Transcript_19213/g.41635 Transcript_19213/m.41635 type:complete len:1158 (-) Transcript_19213:1600-5073(-)
MANPSIPSSAEGAAAAAEADVIEVVCVLLQDFYDKNDAQTILATGKILTTLLQNAIAPTPKRSVRLTNPKITQWVVRVHGALGILCSAGFVEAGEYLNYDGSSEQNVLINAICNGLDVKIKELDPSYKIPRKKETAAPAATNAANPFLGDEERQKRILKVKAAQKAKKVEREAAKKRWMEDVEDRRVAAERREALLNARVQAEDLSPDIHVKSSNDNQPNNPILPKPFGDQLAAAARAQNKRARGDLEAESDPNAIRRQLIQECMKNPHLTAKEKQQKVQELMKADPNAILNIASTASNELVLGGPAASPQLSGVPKKDDTMDIADEDKKPAARKAPPPPLNNNDLVKARSRTPPSTEWAQFIEQVPRCAGAEGIRESSVYCKQASSDVTVPKCLKRLFKELDGLKDNLPADPNCSIWLRFDDETPQYIRALVAAPLPGPTPYSGGVFVFDIYVPNDYPKSNPKVQLLTTGNGTVRFGPNLYADGKVCLSLLGTWEGPGWNEKHSSLYQVLISIQGLILGVEHPYYLEPGHGGWEGNVKEGDFQAKGQTLSGQTVHQELGVPIQVVLYEDVLRVGTVKYAMVQSLKWALEGSMSKHGLEAFSEIIQAHFCENRSSILEEVRNWTCDCSLGRNRSKALEFRQQRRSLTIPGANKDTLQIDALQGLLPKLKELLSKASMPHDRSIIKPAPTCTDAKMDVEEDDSKPLANSSSEEDKKQPSISAKSNTASAASEVDVVEQNRQIMKEAAANGDFILAGKLQEEIKRLDELQSSMQDAAAKGDYVRAGRLQAQLNALAASTNTTAASAANHANQQSTSAWNSEPHFDEEDDAYNSESMDWDEMDEDGPSFAHPGGNSFPHPGIGSNTFAPPGPGYNSHMKRSWGTGARLGDNTVSVPAAATTNTVESAKEAAPKQIIPPDQLCRLRIRLPQNSSVVEDFNKNESLSAVYRRLESVLPPGDEHEQSAVAGPAVGGAFGQPLSSAGFTLLLTRPKKEFSLEMHGIASLVDLNLFPSASLTVMMCKDRGIALRGEVESRFAHAQGDAMNVEGLTYEGLMEVTERVGRATHQIDMEQFDAATEKVSPSAYLADLDNDSTEEHGEEERRCPICLGCYDNSDNSPSLLTVRNCGHTMHSGCLQTWMKTNSSCPLCKTSIIVDGKRGK